jgi:hypothetical protein
MISRKLTPQEFCDKFLPTPWNERDLQLYVQRVIKHRWGAGIFQPPDEVVVVTPNSRRRIDLATLIAVYECKCWLTYDNVYHAIAQTEIYTRYGGKILGVVKKRRVVIGVAPVDFKEYQSAKRLADDFSKLRGITVIFINECPKWHLHSGGEVQVNKYLIYIIYFLILFIISFVVFILIK